MNARYPEVADRAGHRCEYCGAPEAVFNFPFEVEHVVPVSHGGPTEPGNLALACRSCNLRKAASVGGIDPDGGTQVRLFNPRHDRWADNFRFDTDRGEIVGLSPMGRATVHRLAMNSEAQRTARRQWARLGLFP